MKFNPVTRRHFLQGSGGTLLSLPYMTSLIPQNALANADPTPAFFYIHSEHGGVNPEDIYGDLLGYLEYNERPSGLNETFFMEGGNDAASGKSYPDHTIRSAQLVNFLRTAQQANDSDDPDNGQERLSYILSAKFNDLIPKITLLRGLDHHWWAHGHGQGMLLGNFTSIQNKSTKEHLKSAPSIDSVLANSNKFYKSLHGVTIKQYVGPTRPASFDMNHVEMPSTETYTRNLFNKLFTGAQSDTNNPIAEKKSFIIDRVLEDHQRFLSPISPTGRRLSLQDRNAYERFLNHLSEVNRQLKASANCELGEEPENHRMVSNWDNHVQIWQTVSEMMALAFSCGACRLGTAHLEERFLTRDMSYAGSYHSKIAHGEAGADVARAYQRKFHRIALEEAYLQMIETLDSYPGLTSGTTMLDQSLVVFQPQAGIKTHKFINNFAVTAGNAGGKFNTGLFIDYRNLDNLAFKLGNDELGPGAHPGLAQNQFLATILQGMGLAPSDYENRDRFNGPAYGGWHVAGSKLRNNGHIGMPQKLIDRSGEPLPIWWKV